VVDWEAAGWDDPARLVMGFVAHATSEDLASGQATTFLRTYAQASGLSTSEVARFERVGALLELEWVAIYASALTADAVAAKQFANRDLDRSAYLSGTIDRLKSRLERARSGAICRSWPS
jgi:hypothetical protein